MKEKLSRDLVCNYCSEKLHLQVEVDNTTFSENPEEREKFLVQMEAFKHGWVYCAGLYYCHDHWRYGAGQSRELELYAAKEKADRELLVGFKPYGSFSKRTVRSYLCELFGLAHHNSLEDYIPDIFSLEVKFNRFTGTRRPLRPEILEECRRRLALELDLDGNVDAQLHDIFELDEDVSANEHLRKLKIYIRPIDGYEWEQLEKRGKKS